MLTVRPKIAELSFQVYGRSLHPELFELCRSQTLDKNRYSAQIHITSAGHVISWTYKGLTITEVATSAQHCLPKQRRLACYPLRGAQQKQISCRGGIEYETSFELETVSSDTFWSIQQQLSQAGSNGLLYEFGSSGRVAMGAISYIHTETRSKRLRVRAIHTFPDDYAFVKSETYFTLKD